MLPILGNNLDIPNAARQSGTGTVGRAIAISQSGGDVLCLESQSEIKRVRLPTKCATVLEWQLFLLLCVYAPQVCDNLITDPRHVKCDVAPVFYSVVVVVVFPVWLFWKFKMAHQLPPSVNCSLNDIDLTALKVRICNAWMRF